MSTTPKFAALIAALVLGVVAGAADAKDKVKVGFIGPLTGGVSVNGLGGRNSADLAVRLRNADPKSKYEYEMVVLDDECKPNIAVQVATKMAADKDIIAGATHYCSAAAIATVDVYHKFGFPVIVWGAVLPDGRARLVRGVGADPVNGRACLLRDLTSERREASTLAGDKNGLGAATRERRGDRPA